MIGLEAIAKTIELAVWSSRIKDESPVSILITSQPEAGKTQLVMKFAENKGCVALTDVTAYGIMRDYGQKITNREIRHIIIPDLIKPMSRGKDTVHTLVTFLNALIEEGVYRVSTYAERLGAPPAGASIETEPIPVKCGIIVTIAKDELLDGRHHWTRIGFMSRMLPISYDYGAPTQHGIHKSIAAREYLSEEPIMLNLPDEDVEVQLERQQAEELMTLTTTLIASWAMSSIRNPKTPERVYGFRLQKNLQRLAMANTISEGRDAVEPVDVEVIEAISKYINLHFLPL